MKIDVQNIVDRLTALEGLSGKLADAERSLRAADEANGKLLREHIAISEEMRLLREDVQKRFGWAERKVGEVLSAFGVADTMVRKCANDTDHLRELMRRKYDLDVRAGVTEEMARRDQDAANKAVTE